MWSCRVALRQLSFVLSVIMLGVVILIVVMLEVILLTVVCAEGRYAGGR